MEVTTPAGQCDRWAGTSATPSEQGSCQLIFASSAHLPSTMGELQLVPLADPELVQKDEMPQGRLVSKWGVDLDHNDSRSSNCIPWSRKLNLFDSATTDVWPGVIHKGVLPKVTSAPSSPAMASMSLSMMSGTSSTSPFALGLEFDW